MLAHHAVLAINLMSSPGSGKTSLLEKLAEMHDFSFGVVEGDLETNRDADRLLRKGVPAIQIQTGSACHLDAFMVGRGLRQLPLADLHVCFVENVGNLVCPASYDVGAHLNTVLLSVPEGDDKVDKYPVIFAGADLVLITKTDLLDFFDFDIKKVRESVGKINPRAQIMEISTKEESSVARVASWVRDRFL